MHENELCEMTVMWSAEAVYCLLLLQIRVVAVQASTCSRKATQRRLILTLAAAQRKLLVQLLPVLTLKKLIWMEWTMRLTAFLLKLIQRRLLSKTWTMQMMSTRKTSLPLIGSHILTPLPNVYSATND